MARTDRRTVEQAVGADYIGSTPWQPVNASGWHSHSHRSHRKSIKRASHKRNRRREVPHTSMRGYGWGTDNVNYYLAG